MFGIKVDAAKKIAKEVKALAERRIAIQQRLDAARAAHGAARQGRLDLLIAGEPSGAAASAASAAVAAAVSDVEAWAEVLAALDGRLQDARARQAQAEDSETREAAAAAREADAVRIGEAAVELDHAIQAIGAAFERLCVSTPDGCVPVRFSSHFDTAPMNVIELARAVLASGLYRRLPEVFELVDNPQLSLRSAQIRLRALSVRGLDLNLMSVPEDTPFDDAIAAAEKILCAHLRQLAPDIRSGAASPDLPSQPPARLAAE
jgi:hypothetical protein